jgi:NAD(P)-dependent dehydrogenase (short-subunit alcohol dehydrogenase family)
MSWTLTDLPDLTGTTAMVTGANSGIGLATARALATHGATLVLACRNVAAAEEAARAIPGSTSVEPLDLASLASVRAFAERWAGPLDLLVNNAGVMTPPRYRETADGFELQFGTNHLSHFALTGLLLPALLEAPRPRVATVSSIAHFGGDRGVLDGNPREGYRPQKTYSQSKLANLLFARELHRRATSSGSTLASTAAHPGVSATNLVTSPDGMGALPLVRYVAPFFLRVVLQSAEAGALPTLYAATQAAPGSYTGPQRMGESRGPIGPAKLSSYAADESLGRELWARSEEWTGVEFVF